ncbi:MAG: 3'-5' exoribonuclease YhaM family protein [Luteolibacter sp.]|jgi:3'-5' exoribonuclease
MTTCTIAQLKTSTGEDPLELAVPCQFQSAGARSTKAGKPYLELTFADATDQFTIKLWSDSPLYADAEALAPNTFLRLEGRWTRGEYGIDVKQLRWHALDENAIADFLQGDPETRARQQQDLTDIRNFCATITDPRLHALCAHFLDTMGEHFARTAAAKKNHHARRGGLVEHVAQMMRSANALCGVYPELNRDLLITAVLFHDVGKLWENSYPADGFAQQQSIYGEMLGHIPLGIELVNKLWQDVSSTTEAESWDAHKPSNAHVRLHLLHLIASHHGQFEFGSPTLPRTPEAYALHHIDNLDAKLEMVRCAYQTARETTPGIHERVFPLPAPLVRPLLAFQPPLMPEPNSTGSEPDPEIDSPA